VGRVNAVDMKVRRTTMKMNNCILMLLGGKISFNFISGTALVRRKVMYELYQLGVDLTVSKLWWKRM
jgi:hypothetical protein